MKNSNWAWLWLNLFVFSFVPGLADCQAQAWLDYESYSTPSEGPPLLPDFSWAGYKFSNEAIPNITGPIFNVVTQFGAVNDGSQYCENQIQAAINAAGSAGGGVVYFPKGEYLLSSPGTASVLRISRSNIVLRGEGAEDGGTMLYMLNPRVDNALIDIQGHYGDYLTAVDTSAPSGSLQLRVEDPTKLDEGDCFMLDDQDRSYTPAYFGEATLQPAWTETVVKGTYIHEAHCVKSINCSTGVVTMTEPLKLFLSNATKPYRVVSYKPVRNIGIENMRIKGGWATVPGQFCHHCSSLDDSGWSAIHTSAVRDMWVRDCIFEDFVRSAMLVRTQGATVKNCTVMGKKGHFSFQSKRGYGNLFVDNSDLSGAHHGPSVEASDIGTVYLRHKMQPGQYIDMHALNPRYTLLDSVVGGVLTGNGGAWNKYPHHGNKLVLWNFEIHGAGNAFYSFWTNSTSAPRSQNVFLSPIVVGVSGDAVSIDPDTCLHLEGLGQVVQPSSLFEAQLLRRQAGLYTPSTEYPICEQGCGHCKAPTPEIAGMPLLLFIALIVAAVALLLGLAAWAMCRRKTSGAKVVALSTCEATGKDSPLV